jgi:hypothetical protein
MSANFDSGNPKQDYQTTLKVTEYQEVLRLFGAFGKTLLLNKTHKNKWKASTLRESLIKTCLQRVVYKTFQPGTQAIL